MIQSHFIPRYFPKRNEIHMSIQIHTEMFIGFILSQKLKIIRVPQ